jgi:ATP-dependent DNA helicase RecQ
MKTQPAQLSDSLHMKLAEHWGYTAFRPMQEEVMRAVLAGQDTLALLPTGGGKSLCYQVPALCMGKLCLVVSPLIALMKDQVEHLRARGIAARAITSGMAWAEVDNTLESAAVGKLAFLYVSPERLASDLFKSRLPRLPIGLIAVDEAHCIAQWGYDFRPAYLNIAEVREQIPDVPILALTASATPDVAKEIMQRLAFRKENLLRGSFARPELVLWVSRGEDRMGRLLRILKHVEGSAIVYMRERRGTVRIAHFLQQQGIAAEAYHAGLSGPERDRIQRAWTKSELRCVVATNAFGMGIDKADVRCVVHMEPPPDLESYYQEAGRAGRDGRTAHAFLLTGPGDKERAFDRLRMSFPPAETVRRAYQAFADQHGIAIGSGFQETYSLDIPALASRTALPPFALVNSMKVLELNGTIALSDGAHTPSRIFMLANQRTIYHLRLEDQRSGPLIETLLRLHGGLFEEAAVVDEMRIARMLSWEVKKVIKHLTELDQQGVLAYRPRVDAPMVTLLLPRQDAARLILDPAALRDREARATARLQAMIDFVQNKEMCRMRAVLQYFGELDGANCGNCDPCHARLGRARGTEHMPELSEPLGVYQRNLHTARWMRDEYGADGDEKK